MPFRPIGIVIVKREGFEPMLWLVVLYFLLQKIGGRNRNTFFLLLLLIVDSKKGHLLHTRKGEARHVVEDEARRSKKQHDAQTFFENVHKSKSRTQTSYFCSSCPYYFTVKSLSVKALVLHELNKPLVYQDVATPDADEEKFSVRLMAAALNRRDWWITQGQYSKIQLPVILGSDGAGVGPDGQAVVLYPAFDWGDNPSAQGKEFRVLGLPEDGTFAEYIRIPRAHLAPIPAHLTWEQAAALPLAGLTAYRTLFTRCRLQAGERVLITGIGGGVALMAMQFALAAGADVFVTSGSDEKMEQAILLGAGGGANYRQESWDKDLKSTVGGFDVVVDSAGGDGFALLPGLCNPGARIGIYGGSLGKINGLSPQILYWKQISILGSTMGTREEFSQMLDFVSRHQIVPVVDSVFPLSEGNAAMERLGQSEQFGKIVLAIN